MEVDIQNAPAVDRLGPAADIAGDAAAIVAALKVNAGSAKGVRPSFAKGQCVEGEFTPAREASIITSSKTFTRPGKVLGRFAVGGGNPQVADNNRTVLRGFSVRIGSGSGETDLLFQNAPVHFAKSTAQMLEYLRVRTPGLDGKPDARRVNAFSDAHPETLNQAHFLAGKRLPASFAGMVYYAVHAFPVTNPGGIKRFVKFELLPVDGELALSEEEARGKPADFLFQDLKSRIADGGLHFELVALLDRPGDPVMDVTMRWTDEEHRHRVMLGTLHITALCNNGSCDETVFDPGKLAPGVGEPPDEMFAARKIAYAMSLARRRKELDRTE
jgi:catalase